MSDKDPKENSPIENSANNNTAASPIEAKKSADPEKASQNPSQTKNESVKTADKKSSADSALPEEAVELDGLKSKLVELEAKRGSQKKIRNAGVLALVIVIAFLVNGLYSIYSEFDSETYNKNLQEEARHVFEPRLKTLQKRSQETLIPMAKEAIKQLVDEQLPAYKKQLEDLGETANEEMKTALLDSVHNLFEKLQKQLTDELGKEFENIIVDNQEFEEIVAEELYEKLATSEDIVARIMVDIEKLKEDNPHIMKLHYTDAEKLLLTSMLDVLKYEIDDELGKSKEARR